MSLRIAGPDAVAGAGGRAGAETARGPSSRLNEDRILPPIRYAGPLTYDEPTHALVRFDAR